MIYAEAVAAGLSELWSELTEWDDIADDFAPPSTKEDFMSSLELATTPQEQKEWLLTQLRHIFVLGALTELKQSKSQRGDLLNTLKAHQPSLDVTSPTSNVRSLRTLLDFP